MKVRGGSDWLQRRMRQGRHPCSPFNGTLTIERLAVPRFFLTMATALFDFSQRKIPPYFARGDRARRRTRSSAHSLRLDRPRIHVISFVT